MPFVMERWNEKCGAGLRYGRPGLSAQRIGFVDVIKDSAWPE
jgi:hypothetical protein